MKKLFIPILLTSTLFAHSTKTQVNSYVESLDFKNSVQKYNGTVAGLGATVAVDNSIYKITYEKTFTNTKKPALNKDLKVDKLFFKYAYNINKKWSVNLNYLNILNDNIAITTHGKTYGVGITYRFTPKTALNFTQFFSDYKDFNTYQSEFKLNHKIVIDELKTKLSFITKLIKLDDYQSNGFSKFAQEDYKSFALKTHSHYNSYHFGFGAFFGKRAFAIMQDGFKIQHHAMEFDRTYAGGVGKDFGKLTLRLQHTYQRAIELPVQNGKKVTVNNSRILLNYKF